MKYRYHLATALVASLILLLTASNLRAFDVVNLWPTTPPGDDASQYQDQGGPWYTPRIEFWRPENQRTRACVLICCGGCYNGVAYEVEGIMPRDFFLEKGVAVCMMWYRTPRRPNVEKHFAAWQDVQRAIRIIRSNAKDWGIDEDKIGVMGFSAGGTYASWPQRRV